MLAADLLGAGLAWVSEPLSNAFVVFRANSIHSRWKSSAGGVLEEGLELGGGRTEDDGPPGRDEDGAPAAQLQALLQESADASGTLAAIESIQHVAELSRSAAAQQAQRAQRDMAAFAWRHEPALLRALPAGALGPAPALSPPPPRPGAAPAPGVHPLVTGWGVRSHRRELLARLQSGVNTLLSLDGPLQRWAETAARVEEQWEAELAPVMPFAPGYLQVCVSLSALPAVVVGAQARLAINIICSV